MERSDGDKSWSLNCTLTSVLIWGQWEPLIVSEEEEEESE